MEPTEIWRQPCEYGVVLTDRDGRITGLVEKPTFILLSDGTLQTVDLDGNVVESQTYETWSTKTSAGIGYELNAQGRIG